MTIIEVTGRVNERGQLEFEPPHDLPPGEVRIIFKTISAEEEAADEALWDEKFAKSQEMLEQMAQEAHEEYLAPFRRYYHLLLILHSKRAVVG